MLIKALMSLRPGAEFTITNDDLSTIVWNVEGTVTPTQEEVDAEISRLQTAQAQEVVDKEYKKASALAKLEALGLTADDLAAILN